MSLWCVLIVLGACKPAQRPSDQNNAAAAQNVVKEEPAPALEPSTMDRAQLLAAVAQAASTAASGGDDRSVQRDLDGRRFEVRIRFGCAGPAEKLATAALGWSYDEESRTLRVRAQPTIAGDEPLAKQAGGEGVEDIEGFWLPRPWLLDAACPAAVAGEAQSEEGEGATEELRGPRIGIAEFFTEADARSARRDHRAYESTKAADRAPVAGEGFNLVLSGRLNALASGKVISCIAQTSDRPPDCIVSARFDQAWIEWPDDRAVVAQWSRT